MNRWNLLAVDIYHVNLFPYDFNLTYKILLKDIKSLYLIYLLLIIIHYKSNKMLILLIKSIKPIKHNNSNNLLVHNL